MKKGEKMKNHHFVNVFMVITLAIVLGFGTAAFAGPGRGYGRGGYGPGMVGYGPCTGYGPQMMGPGYGPGPGMMAYGPGYGRGPGMMAYGPGYGRGPESGRGPGMMAYGPGMAGGFRGYGYAGDLSAEDLKKLDEQRKAFFEGTENLRNDIYEKRLELRSELAKQNPDASKAGKLQKEISELKTQLGQKRIDHLIEMKKINPNVGRGFAAGGFRGTCWR